MSYRGASNFRISNSLIQFNKYMRKNFLPKREIVIRRKEFKRLPYEIYDTHLLSKTNKNSALNFF